MRCQQFIGKSKLLLLLCPFISNVGRIPNTYPPLSITLGANLRERSSLTDFPCYYTNYSSMLRVLCPNPVWITQKWMFSINVTALFNFPRPNLSHPEANVQKKTCFGRPFSYFFYTWFNAMRTYFFQILIMT